VVPGGWFPHMVPAEKPKYIGNCVCLEDSSVAVIPIAVLKEFAARWPGLFRGLYHEFIDRMVVILGRIELLSLHNLDVRLAVYLLRMAHLRGVPGPGGSIWVAAHDSQSEIGTRVGGTRQRVNKILKAWSQKRIIELHKDGTRILDVPRLTTEAKRSGFDLDAYLAGWHGGWQGTK
jgi:CRP/FNR family transcriptional regulator, cyclic AMP receptor protein